jgi:hypothetical protein
LASVIVKLLKYASLRSAGAKAAGPWLARTEQFLNPAPAVAI